jgi:hypothetical protein
MMLTSFAQEKMVLAAFASGADSYCVKTTKFELLYVPMRVNPVILSVGNTGWQVSDIWKDIRLDSF